MGLSFGKDNMRQPKNIAMIKATARERLYGRLGTTVGATLLFILIQMVISDIVISMVNPNNIITYVIYLLSAVLVEVLLGVFYSGMAYLYMNVIYAQPATAKDLFHGFVMHPDKALLLQIPFALASSLQVVPISILRNFGLGMKDNFIYPLMICLAIIGTVLYIGVNLVFSQVYYLLQDFPDKSAMEIFEISKKLMQGNKLRLVKLYLSFIPLLLLGILTLFLPLLWVKSYMESSLAAFYQDCIAVSAQISETER